MKGILLALLASACVLKVAASDEDAFSNLLKKLLDIDTKEHKRGKVTLPTECGVNKFQNEYPKHEVKRDLTVLDLLQRLLGEEKQEEKRIMGGEKAMRGAHPWIADITIWEPNGEASNCGGSLIHPEWIVTAAHCFYGSPETGFPDLSENLDDFVIVLGDHNVDILWEPSEVEFQPAKIILHPLYNVSYDESTHDIAIVKLDKPATLNDNIKVICFPDAPIPAGSECVASGWGIDDTGKAPDIIHEVFLQTMTLSGCQEEHDFPVKDGMLCAWRPNVKPFADACAGDSGGPLACSVNGRYTLGGVTSMGDDCSQEANVPGVYADVYYYRDWILENMEKYS